MMGGADLGPEASGVRGVVAIQGSAGTLTHAIFLCDLDETITLAGHCWLCFAAVALEVWCVSGDGPGHVWRVSSESLM